MGRWLCIILALCSAASAASALPRPAAQRGFWDSFPAIAKLAGDIAAPVTSADEVLGKLSASLEAARDRANAAILQDGDDKEAAVLLVDACRTASEGVSVARESFKYSRAAASVYQNSDSPADDKDVATQRGTVLTVSEHLDKIGAELASAKAAVTELYDRMEEIFQEAESVIASADPLDFIVSVFAAPLALAIGLAERGTSQATEYFDLAQEFIGKASTL